MTFDADAILTMSGLALYASLFVLPFIQEDVAVIAASTVSLVSVEPVVMIFFAILAGLTASDIWKYWLGYFARRHSFALRFAQKPGVAIAGDLVKDELGKTLFMARFVPGTRIPTYLACGFFKIDYLKFVILVIATAACYVTISFGLFHTVGAVAGEAAKYWLPVIAITIVGGYVLLRWWRHKRNKALGPMTPLTDQLSAVDTTPVDTTRADTARVEVDHSPSRDAPADKN